MTIIKKSTSEGKMEIVENPSQSNNEGEPFPKAARDFLDAFYVARNVTDEEDKKKCLEEITNSLSEHSLKELEYYYLIKCGILN